MTRPPGSRSARVLLSEQARALAEQSDRHAVVLESILAPLRSSRLDDRAARQAAVDVAAAALVDVRTAADVRRQDLLEPVVGAFERLKRDLRPLVRFGQLDVQFVEPPSNGRALPGDVAQSARAIVRSAVLAFVDAAEARRVRIQWDCDGLHLLIAIRDDGRGELHAHDDTLRPIAEHVSALDGRLEVASTPGWGTDLSIAIPLDPAPAASHGDELTDLTARERDVLHHLAAGARNDEIARELRISAHTVKFHISKLLKRTGARNRAELAALYGAAPAAR
ncbi:helix-turn-helix transcriptional regulator [Microbacterium karelineae]|uniref:helix-turn-helix transcriptional regulator n=1 Tax=Microbacterium karelineae TaxID=2654283 RepID=UPI0012EA8ADF|nr:LuxR C-terminal-related transcriptional regulator [Microbacterium karelineae]